MSAFDHTTSAREAAAALRSQIEGRNILITGVAPNSLGAATVRSVAPFAKTIIIASRTLSRSEEVVASIHTASKAEFKLVPLNLSSFASIEKAAKEINSFGLSIHVVINNGAGAFPPTLTKTEEGFETQFGTNHLGHMLLNSLIFPSLKLATKDYHPRIVAITSLAHYWALFRIDDPNYELRPEEYSGTAGYSWSKLANILFAREFARRYKDEGFCAYSVHPGVIRTTNTASNLGDQFFIDAGWVNIDGSLTEKGQYEVKNDDQGAASTVIAAFDPALEEHTGAYIRNGRVETSPDELSKFVTDENAWQLWEVSEQCLKRKFAA